LINIAIFMQVKYTTPLTNAISGTAKACIQTLLGWMFFRNEVSLMVRLWYFSFRYFKFHHIFLID